MAMASPPAAVADMAAASGASALPPPRVEVKLFIGRLPRTAEEPLLRPIFEAFGEVLEIIIIRDRATGMHKGSAFVRMASITQADSAVKALHNTKVIDPQLGPIQVRYANGEPEKLGLTLDAAQAGSDQAKLFVGSLPRGVTEPEVREIFSPFGAITEVFIMKDAVTGQAKGCAFVKFGFKEEALHAIRSLNGIHTCAGCPRPLEVRFAETRKGQGVQQQQQQQQPGLGSALAGNVGAYGAMVGAYTAAGAGLGQQMAAAAPPSNLNPRCAGQWKEYFTADGRPYYHSEISQQTQWTRPAEFDQLPVAPRFPVAGGMGAAGGGISGMAGGGYGAPHATGGAGSDSAGPPGANVFIFHIPNEWNQSDVVANFSHFGRVISCYIATDRMTGRNKGYGFVSYDNVNSAAQAVQNMNGYLFGTKRLKVSIKTGEERYVAHLLGGIGDGSNNAVAAGGGMVGMPQLGGAVQAQGGGMNGEMPGASAAMGGMLGYGMGTPQMAAPQSQAVGGAMYRMSPY